MLNAGVVDQDVHATMLLGKSHHGLDLAGLAHVGRVVHRFDTTGLDQGHRGGGVAKPIEDEIGTLLGQGLGNAQTNATGGAGDESGFTFEHEILLFAHILSTQATPAPCFKPLRSPHRAHHC